VRDQSVVIGARTLLCEVLSAGIDAEPRLIVEIFAIAHCRDAVVAHGGVASENGRIWPKCLFPSVVKKGNM
jgi:hypothetical protein